MRKYVYYDIMIFLLVMPLLQKYGIMKDNEKNDNNNDNNNDNENSDYLQVAALYSLIPIVFSMGLNFMMPSKDLKKVIILTCIVYLFSIISIVGALAQEKEEHTFSSGSTWSTSALSSLYVLAFMIVLSICSQLPPFGIFIIFNKFAKIMLNKFIFAIILYIQLVMQITTTLYLH